MWMPYNKIIKEEVTAHYVKRLRSSCRRDSNLAKLGQSDKEQLQFQYRWSKRNTATGTDVGCAALSQLQPCSVLFFSFL
jgi:hypothetical protein